LLAGGTVIASDDNSLAGSIAEGEFGDSVVTFNPGDAHPQIGQPLGVRLINLNQTAGVPAGNDLEVDFDNVRLTATTVTGPNTAPEIPAIGNQTMATDEVLSIALPTADADGDTISYEVEVVENIAANAHDTYSIHAETWLVNADYGYNYLGQQERWVQSSAGWMFITTEGSLHLWSGAYASSPEVARLDTRYHADPSLLVNAQHIDVSVTISSGQLQLSIGDGYVGELNIRLHASDGLETVDETFAIEVTAAAWAGLVDDVFEEDEDWI
jgi:hypothetical protein